MGPLIPRMGKWRISETGDLTRVTQPAGGRSEVQTQVSLSRVDVSANLQGHLQVNPGTWLSPPTSEPRAHVGARSPGDLMGTAFSSVTSGGPAPTPAPGLSLTPSPPPPWLSIHWHFGQSLHCPPGGWSLPRMGPRLSN